MAGLIRQMAANEQQPDEATERFLSAFTPDLLLELDTKIQEAIRRDFAALIHVCLAGKNMLKDVENAMMNTAVEFTGSMLLETTVSEIMLERHPDAAPGACQVMPR